MRSSHAVAADQLADRLLAHAHAGALQRRALAVQARGTVGAEHDVAAPTGHHQRRARRLGPEPCTASDRSRTSQPSQNGQWKTDRPQSGSTPGSGGGS